MIKESEAFKRAVTDELIHSVTAFFIVSPLLFREGFRLPLIVWTAVTAIGLDFDHFIASRSLSFAKSISLGMRPVGHSFLVAVIIACLFYIFLPFEIALIGTLSLFSHLFLDSVGYGTPLLWPFSERHPGGKKFGFSGILLLFLISLAFAFA